MKKLMLALLLTSVGMSANASQFGCQVLLCLSDARGAEHEKECHPPIEHLKTELAHGHPFPSCNMTDGNDDKSNYTKRVFDYYDPCPDGTTPAAKNTYVAQGKIVLNSVSGLASFKTDNHAQLSESALAKFSGSPSARACVGKQLGSYWTGYYKERGDKVNVYSKVLWQAAQPPHAIDVYINGKFFSRTRLEQ